MRSAEGTVVAWTMESYLGRHSAEDGREFWQQSNPQKV